MKKKDQVNATVTLIGAVIMILVASVAIIDSQASDIVSSIPPTIVGAAMFTSGYISLNINNK